MDCINKDLVSKKFVLDLTVYTDKDDEVCSICFDSLKTVVCMPCGHLCCCYSCFSKLPQHRCILCRANVTGIKLSMKHTSLIKRLKEDIRILELFCIETPHIQLGNITVETALSELLALVHSKATRKQIVAIITAYFNSGVGSASNIFDLVKNCTIHRALRYKILTAITPSMWLTHYFKIYKEDIRAAIVSDRVDDLEDIVDETVGCEIFEVEFEIGTPLHLAISTKSHRCIYFLLNIELELMCPIQSSGQKYMPFTSFVLTKNSWAYTPARYIVNTMDAEAMKLLLRFECTRLKLLKQNRVPKGKYSRSSLLIQDRNNNNCFHAINLVIRDTKMVELLKEYVSECVDGDEVTLILQDRNDKGHTVEEVAELYGDPYCRELVNELKRMRDGL